MALNPYAVAALSQLYNAHSTHVYPSAAINELLSEQVLELLATTIGEVDDAATDAVAVDAPAQPVPRSRSRFDVYSPARH